MFDSVFQPAVPGVAPDNRPVYSCTAGGARGWPREGIALHKRSHWEANEHLLSDFNPSQRN